MSAGPSAGNLQVQVVKRLPAFSLEVDWHGGRRGRGALRPLRGRQDPDPSVPRRARPAGPRAHRRRRRGVLRQRCRDRRADPAAPTGLCLPGLRPLPASVRRGQCGIRIARPAPRGAPPPRGRGARAARAGRPGRAAPARVVGGPATARGPRPGARGGPRALAPRRAALRPGHAAPPAAPPGARGHPARVAQGHRARHPRSGGGVSARRSRRGLRQGAGRARVAESGAPVGAGLRAGGAAHGRAQYPARPRAQGRAGSNRDRLARPRARGGELAAPFLSARARGRSWRSSSGPNTCGSSGRTAAPATPAIT